MSTITINSCFSFLTINKSSKTIHLSSNFNFTVKRDINNHIVTTEIVLNNQYATRVGLKPKIGDSCFISIQNNDGEKILIFSGSITNISTVSDKLILTSFYNCVESELYKETFLEADTKKILESFIPKIQFEAKNQTHPRIILEHSKPENLRKILNIHRMNYFINLKNQVVIIDKFLRKNAQQFDISNCTKETNTSSIVIFPIPELEIGDIVVLFDEKYYVTGITYKYTSSVKMVLGVKKCLT